MRLLRIALRSFRGVHDREITPAASGVTVLEGANEVGKTSTVLALDLLVDTRDSSTRTAVRACQPAGVDAGPEVEAEIVSGPYRFTYRKRWLRRPLTELTVHEPRPEQHTGREAHDRVEAILDETMDRALWRALRVEQHTPLGQVELGGHAALSRALDRAAGGEPGAVDAAAEDLVARVEADLRRYRTAHGRPTGELRDAETRLVAARDERDAAAAAVGAVEVDAAEHARLDERLRGLGAEHLAHQEAVVALEEQWAATESRRGEVESARLRAAAAAARHAVATEQRSVRDAVIAAAAEAVRRVGTAERDAADHAHHHDALRARCDAARTDRDTARDRAAGSASAAADADRALAAAHDHAELADLAARLARVDEADAALAGLHAADPATDALTDADAEHLEALTLDVVRADAAREAGAAVLEVRGEVTVDLDGAPVRPGEAGHVVAVIRPVTLRTPDGVEVRVRPGRDAGALADAARDAADALATACAALGVTDAADARRAAARARETARRRTELAAARERELAGRDPGDLRADHAALVGRCGGHDLPAALPTSRAAATTARERADADAADARSADTAWREAADAVHDADTAAALRAKDLADARHARDRTVAELADARADTADAALAETEARCRDEARAAGADHERLAALLAGDDPETLELRVATARRVDERLRADTLDHERARAETVGRLRLAGSEGRHDRLTAADDARAAAEAEHAAVVRRADAAALLHATLTRHRDDVRRAYVAPFRREVERLARIVFGPDVALEVDDALHLVARTLGGVTVPFDELSAGAKEQLALCARLACAALVDPADGVPVVIDDALGHSDPERLARLGAVFTAATAGAGHQVLVLTSTPERYRGVGGAHVVRVAASRDPVARHPARHSARAGDRDRPGDLTA